MRTTISIDAGLLEDGKRLADELGTSVSGLLSELLRERLAAPPADPAPAPWKPVTFGGGGLRPGVRWADLGALAADDEVERLLAAEP